MQARTFTYRAPNGMRISALGTTEDRARKRIVKLGFSVRTVPLAQPNRLAANRLET